MQKFTDESFPEGTHYTVDSFHSLYFLLNVGTCIKKEDIFLFI